MENASKALIIAGAILISILIILVAMRVFESTGGTMDEAISQMTTTEKTMFNSPFTQYEGEQISGSNVKSLLKRIETNNAGLNAGDARHVAIVYEDGLSITSIKSTQKYKVTCAISTETGLVYQVTISK